MITVMLVNMGAEVLIRRYYTDSEEEACRQLLDDWQDGKIVWEFDDTNEAFTPEWIAKNGSDPIDEGMDPQYQDGIRTMEWYCVNGPKEIDDEIVCGYFLHTVK